MGLLTLLRKQQQQEREIRVLVLGLDNAGKTTIVKTLLNEDVEKVAPTLGFNISTLEIAGFKLNLWDIGGQPSIRSYWRNYFEQTEALVWVVDSADRGKLLECKRQLHELLLEERLAGASLLVFANKQDIATALTVGQIIQVLDLHSIKSHRWNVFACSAAARKSNYCQSSEPLPLVFQGIHWAVNDVASRIFQCN